MWETENSTLKKPGREEGIITMAGAQGKSNLKRGCRKGVSQTKIWTQSSASASSGKGIKNVGLILLHLSFSRILDHSVLSVLVSPTLQLFFSWSLRLKKALEYQGITFFFFSLPLWPVLKTYRFLREKWVKYVFTQSNNQTNVLKF